MTTTKPERPSLASFWHDLPRDGKLLLSVVVFEFIGTGLVLPFWVVYLHEVRDFGLETDVVELTGSTDAGVMLEGGIEFIEGERYLVTATDGTLNGCGFSAVWTQDMADEFEAAFAG